FREPADRLDHQDARPLRQDDLGDASDHCRVDGTLHERVDIAPLENRVSAPPLLRMVIEPRLVPQDAIRAEIHHAGGFGRKREFLIRAGKPQGPSVPDELDLAVRATSPPHKTLSVTRRPPTRRRSMTGSSTAGYPALSMSLNM